MTRADGLPARSPITAPTSVDELEELLSRPAPAVVDALSRAAGDVIVLGAGGKMGPSLVRMLRRAADELGDAREIVAASRFSDAAVADRLAAAGVRVIRADLTDSHAAGDLPDAPNVIFMAGQKFGTRELPSLTWVTNTVMPGLAAERYRASRIVAFSTGNVYPLSAARDGGCTEQDPPAPAGEYAWSCLGRERVLEHASRARGTRMAIVRLNYAVELRYGVLVDLAQRVASGEPLDLRMGYVNVIWQGDANAQAIQCLPLTDVPPLVLNVTGPEVLSVRQVALELGRLLGREPVFTGEEQDDALLSNTSAAQSRFGPPLVSADRVIGWVAEWLQRGGPTLGKSTRFEEREGRF